jgi:uncharacterized protein
VIIDSHCHAGTGDGLTGPWDTAGRLDRYLMRADRAGIDHTVLLPVFTSDYRLANRELAGIVARQPRRFSGYAMVHPVRDKGRILSMIREAVEEFGFLGIKVHRHDARLTREICDAAQVFSLPVLYDVMGETATIEMVAPEYRSVQFIVPHLGSFGDDFRAHLALIDIMARHPNVHADTSGVRRFDYLVELIKRVGPSRLLFGSDGPWLHPGVELAKVRMLGLDPISEGLVLFGNWRRLTLPRPPQPDVLSTSGTTTAASTIRSPRSPR